MKDIRLFFPVLITAALVLAACHRTPRTNIKRYPFTGHIVSIDSHDQSALIDGDDVPGFMMPMAMTYKIRPPDMVKQIAPGDSISAEVVVVQPKDKDDEPSDYWLENIKVTAHSKDPAPKGTGHRIPITAVSIPR